MNRRAFTLLEVILALALAVVVLGLVGVGIHVHLTVAAKSNEQVQEAQLAREVLKRIADDLRNAVPFQPPPPSSGDSGQTSSSGTSGQSGSSSSSSQASSSGTSSSSSSNSSTTPLSGGLYGTAQAIQIETVRRPKATLASMQTAANDPSQPVQLSNIRVVSYGLGVAGHRRPVAADSLIAGGHRPLPPRAGQGGVCLCLAKRPKR